MENTNFNTEPRNQLNIDIIVILSEVIKNWLIIIMSGLIAAMGVFIFVSSSFTPEYKTSATLLVKGEVTAVSTTYSAYTDLSAAKQMADTFTYIMSSRVMLDKVAADLGMDSVPGSISTSVLSETNILTLTATSKDPGISFRILQSVLKNHKSLSKLVIGNSAVEILESPQVPGSPAKIIDYKSVMEKGFLAGSLAMALVIAAAAYMRDTVKSHNDIQKKLDTSLFAAVPRERKKLFRKKLRYSMRNKPVLVTNIAVSFQFSEAFNKIRTRLENKAKKHGYKTIMVTSTLENEGKSTISSNIALALAKGGSRVLIIDGDLKNPSLYRMFGTGVSGKAEIGDVLEGKAEVADALVYDEKYKLWFLLGVKNYERSSELLGSSAMENLLRRVRNEFDYVIIDTPPAKVVTDAAVLTQYADALLLIVKQNYAKSGIINDVIDILSGNRAKLIGCIYNKALTEGISERYGYGYGYGYSYKYGYGYQRES